MKTQSGETIGDTIRTVKFTNILWRNSIQDKKNRKTQVSLKLAVNFLILRFTP
jgi:flagellar biosynthesis regulator FlaF